MGPARREILALEPEEGWAEAWRKELDRRMTEIRSGKVAGVPAEEVLARLRERCRPGEGRGGGGPIDG